MRENQKNAINISVNNNFKSGVHFHATGTGKSWIALELILKFNKLNKNCNILWICEKKSILIEQFTRKTVEAKGFGEIYKNFQILNYSDRKQKDWYNSVNVSKFWNSSTLIIINRHFLTSSKKYEKITLPINLIIHDECHSIINKTTKEFYKHILHKNEDTRCIGFSATPSTTDAPFDTILSKYTIYNAYLDGVICTPKIKWFKSDTKLSYEDTITLFKGCSKDLVYNKIIIWAGMIELCHELAQLWKKSFPNFTICVDTSLENKKFDDFETFQNLKENCILFCAGKHREGSDIQNLDCCIFLDYVADRSAKTFVQCIGRVLRKDPLNKKKFGLILDVNAKSSVKLCDRMSEFFGLPPNTFPWKYYNNNVYIGNKSVCVNSLELIKPQMDEIVKIEKQPNQFTEHDLRIHFKRDIPNKNEYKERLRHELQLIHSKNLIGYIIHGLEILNLTKNIPHITRGSCGSSLVCYLLGISHVDPVKYNINFARFLNIYRDTLPDIDFDFPYNLRDDVFLQIHMKWPGKVARISNHVFYHQKSATREALRRAGVRKFISKDMVYNEINKLSKIKKNFVAQETKKIDNTFKCYSLHCGGIVYYPNGIPSEILLTSKQHSGLNQIYLNKVNVASMKKFKIDILSSRGLAQLNECMKHESINFEDYEDDKKTWDMLQRGDNIGITLAESPLIRKTFMKIKPRNISDLALCLSVIRPSAADSREDEFIREKEDVFIYDDDAIELIKKYLNCSDAEADKCRRQFSKGKKKGLNELYKRLNSEPKNIRDSIIKKLNNLKKYGFCKSHAFSYAQLVWKLAYMKANYPVKFWKATLKHCKSAYKKWVHVYQARLHGVGTKIDKNISIFAENRQKGLQESDTKLMINRLGYWDKYGTDFYPKCFFIEQDGLYYFNGLIASSKIKYQGNKISTLIFFIGVEANRYIELVVEKQLNYKSDSIGIKGECILDRKGLFHSKKYTFY